MELLPIWQRGFYRECFALSKMGVEGAGGGFYRRAGVLRGGGVVLLPATMAVGALQKGAWVAVVRCKGGVGRW
jgi:hypothetical protein